MAYHIRAWAPRIAWAAETDPAPVNSFLISSQLAAADVLNMALEERLYLSSNFMESSLASSYSSLVI